MASTKTSPPPQRSVYLEPFGSWGRANDSAWCPALRRAGIQEFDRAGIPTTRDEDWRFTPLTPLTRLPFRPLLSAPALLPALEQLDFPPDELVDASPQGQAALALEACDDLGVGLTVDG